MRKLLLFISLLVISSHCYAGQITGIDDFSADSTVNHLNTFKNSVLNEINASIEGSSGTGSAVNVAADSISEIEMFDDANPRIFTNELLGVGVDTTTSATAVVTSGLVPADDTDLSSDISAGVAYINGYRVSKNATSRTYTASKDTYVDLDVNGNYTFQEVTVGASAPSVAANSARVALVTTDGSQITSVTDLANRRIPNLIIPSNFRDGFNIAIDATNNNVLIEPGSVEINNSIVSIATDSTFALTTAGNWAGGSSLQATSTYGYVGIDSSANIKLHTTAPTNSNYDLSQDDGILRYASWSSTTYRVLGWFYMNATGSGELDEWGGSNLSEFGLTNRVCRKYSTDDTTTSATYEDLDGTTVNFYSSGQNWTGVNYSGTIDTVGSGTQAAVRIVIDSAPKKESLTGGGSGQDSTVHTMYHEILPIGTHTIDLDWKRSAGSDTVTMQNGIYKQETCVEEY